MGIKDKECIGAPIARPFADFLQRLDGKRAPAFQGAFALRQQQRGHVGDFGGKHDLAHGVSCDGVSAIAMWANDRRRSIRRRYHSRRAAQGCPFSATRVPAFGQ